METEAVDHRRKLRALPASMAVGALAATRFLVTLFAVVFFSCSFRLLLQGIDDFDQFIDRKSMFLFCNLIILFITKDSGLLGIFAPPLPPPSADADAEPTGRAWKTVGDRRSSKRAVVVAKGSCDEVEKRDMVAPVDAVVAEPSTGRDQKTHERRSSKRDDAVAKSTTAFSPAQKMQDRRSSEKGAVVAAPAIADEVIKPCVYVVAGERRIKDEAEKGVGCLDLVAVGGAEEEDGKERIINPSMEEEEDTDELHKKIEEFIENFKSQRRMEALQLNYLINQRIVHTKLITN